VPGTNGVRPSARRFAPILSGQADDAAIHVDPKGFTSLSDTADERISIGAPRFELGTSSPPGCSEHWREVRERGGKRLRYAAESVRRRTTPLHSTATFSDVWAQNGHCAEPESLADPTCAECGAGDRSPMSAGRSGSPTSAKWLLTALTATSANSPTRRNRPPVPYATSWGEVPMGPTVCPAVCVVLRP
jgi:hypothetical protein